MSPRSWKHWTGCAHRPRRPTAPRLSSTASAGRAEPRAEPAADLPADLPAEPPAELVPMENPPEDRVTEQGFSAAEIDTSKPHPARPYDFYLGGKDHYEVDREAAFEALSAFPSIQICAQVNRLFMHRATRWLAA